MAIAIVSILMIIVGILIFLWSGAGKEIGRACFYAGFIGLALAYAHRMVKFGSVAVALVPILLIVVGIIGWLWHGPPANPPPKHSTKEIWRGMFFGGFVGIAVAYAATMIKVG